MRSARTAAWHARCYLVAAALPAGTALRTELAWVKWKLDAMGSFPSGPEILERLGLLGMRERVAFLGGEIVFEGGAERGTSVTVRIPRSPSRRQTGPRADGEDSGPG